MKVLLIDDHPLILSAMQSVIRHLDNHVQVVGVETADEARSLLRQRVDFDLVLLDLQLGDVSGFDVLLEFRAHYPALPVVVVSASDRPSDMLRCIDSGAMGYVPKRSSTEMLFEALHLVMSGGIYVPPVGSSSGDGDVPAADRLNSLPGAFCAGLDLQHLHDGHAGSAGRARCGRSSQRNCRVRPRLRYRCRSRRSG